MGYKCCITDCPTGKSKSEKKQSDTETNVNDEIANEEQPNDEKVENGMNIENDEKECNKTKIGVFSFPHQDEDIERRLKWIHFVNRKNFKVTAHTRICELHFEEKYINR